MQPTGLKINGMVLKNSLVDFGIQQKKAQKTHGKISSRVLLIVLKALAKVLKMALIMQKTGLRVLENQYQMFSQQHLILFGNILVRMQQESKMRLKWLLTL